MREEPGSAGAALGGRGERQRAKPGARRAGPRLHVQHVLPFGTASLAGGTGGACFVVASARRPLQAGAEVLGGRVSRPGNPSKAQPANLPVEGGVRQSSAFLVQSEPGTWATRLKEGTGTLRSWTILQTGTVTVPTSRAPAVRRMQRLVLQRGPHGTFVAPRGGGHVPPFLAAVLKAQGDE